MPSVYLVKSDKPYYNLVVEYATRQQMGSAFEEIPVTKCASMVQSFIRSQERATFIIDGDDIKIFDKILQIFSRFTTTHQKFSSIHFIILSNMQTFAQYHQKGANPGFNELFLNRKPPVYAMDAYQIENRLFQMNLSGKFRVSMLLLGLFYGGKGNDLYNAFNSIWWNKFHESNDIKTTKVLPNIHYERFQALLHSLIEDKTSQYGFLVPAFDGNSQTLTDMLLSINEKINPDSAKAAIVTSSSGATSSLSPFVEKMNITPFLPLLSTATATSSTETVAKDLETNWEATWKEFVALNGLSPVSICVTGPPRTGKSQFCKDLAKIVDIKVVEFFDSVISTLRFGADESLVTTTFPAHLDRDKFLEYYGKLKTFLEAKVAENAKPVKGGKKDAAPAIEPGILDINAVTEQHCTSLPSELILFALSCKVNVLDVVCQRRGYVYDLWDKNVIEEIEQFGTIKHFLDKTTAAVGSEEPGEDSNSSIEPLSTIPKNELPIDMLIEFTCPETYITERLTEFLGGAAGLKSKDNQATLKAVEASVTTYFANTSLIEPGYEKPACKSHQKVIKYAKTLEEQGKGDALVRVEAKGIQAQGLFTKMRSVLQALSGRKVCTWIPLTEEEIAAEEEAAKNAAAVAAASAAAAMTVSIEEAGVVETTLEQSASTESTTVPSSSSITANKTAAATASSVSYPTKVKEGAVKYDQFLTNTVLPVIGKGLVDIMRAHPDDPILYIAQYLAFESEKQQAEAYENARRNFEELLQS